MTARFPFAAVLAALLLALPLAAQTPADSLRTELVRSRAFTRGAHTQIVKTRAVLDRRYPKGADPWADSLRAELIRAQGMASSSNTQLTKTLAVLDRHRGQWVAADAVGWTMSAPLMADDHTLDPERRRVVFVVPFDSTAARGRAVVLDSLGRVLRDTTFTGPWPLPVVPDSTAAAADSVS